MSLVCDRASQILEIRARRRASVHSTDKHEFLNRKNSTLAYLDSSGRGQLLRRARLSARLSRYTSSAVDALPHLSSSPFVFGGCRWGEPPCRPRSSGIALTPFYLAEFCFRAFTSTSTLRTSPVKTLTFWDDPCWADSGGTAMPGRPVAEEDRVPPTPPIPKNQVNILTLLRGVYRILSW